MKKIGQFFSRRKERKGTGASNGSSGEKKGSGKENMDYLFLQEEREIQDILKEGELIFYSDNIEKFNRKNKKQKRSIMITNHFVYNLKGLTLKRKIEIQKIKKIITSRFSGEFILNVPDEYDYRYISSDDSQKQVIIEILCKISMGLQILYADQAELAEVVTTRKEKEQQQQFCSILYGTTAAQDSTNQSQVSPKTSNFNDINITQHTTQRNSILNNLLSLNLFSHSSHHSHPANLYEQDKSKEDGEFNKERRLKKVPSFERGIQMNFNDFELIEYFGICDAWRYFRVKECGNESKKVYQMRVINTHTHLKMEGDLDQQITTTHKQFVQEQIQLMKELDSSYFSQQYYYIEQGHYFAVLQEELDTSKYIDLAQLIDEQSFLHENVAKVIAAQTAHSLHILHQKKIVYNQVNPYDIKIDLAGNTILTRFEFSKFFFTPFTVSPTSSMTSLSPKNSSTNGINKNSSNNTLTFSSSTFNTDDSPKKSQINQKSLSTHCKTDYSSPETIKGTQNSYNADWWSFGILLYEMLLGFTPFFDQNPSKMEQKILTQKDIDFPKMANISSAAKNLILKCLDKNPKSRIKGADILNHEFFTGIKWVEIKERVPQFEVSQLFNLEKQYSEECTASSTQKEVEGDYDTDQTNKTVSQSIKYQIIVHGEQEEENEDEEETIILSGIRNIGKDDKLYSKNFNFLSESRNTFQLVNKA